MSLSSKVNNESLKVTVLCGGSSPERFVSLAGGCYVATNLRECNYIVDVLDPVNGLLSFDEEKFYLSSNIGQMPPSPKELQKFSLDEDWIKMIKSEEIYNCDLVFPVLHGKDGEDGKLQALLDLAKVLYVGSTHIPSGIAMDKDLSKRLFQFSEIATPDWVVWDGNEDFNLTYPIIVKPSKTGSTVGVQLVNSKNDLYNAIKEAKKFDDEILLENYIDGREFTVGILNGKALEVGEIICKDKIFDYHSKYTYGMVQEVFPAQISEDLRKNMKDIAERVHRQLKLRHFSRVDFKMTNNNEIFVLEVNTLPGLTKLSLLPQSAVAAGYPFSKFCREVCERAMQGN